MTFGDLDGESDYLRFVEEPNPGKKTRRWRIESKSSGQRLGRVGWWGAWRQYVLSPHLDTVWNKGCLEAVNEFLDAANKAWRDEKSTVDA